MIEPRFAWAPPRARSLGADAVAFWEAAGGTLFDWQKLVIDAILGIGDDGRWASVDDGLEVARQNGKGVILQVIELFVAFELGARHGYELVMHTAHEFATSQDHQLRLDAMVQDAPHLHVRVKEKGGYKHANGQESLNLKDGTQIRFKARTKAGARGWSGDLLVWDEAMVISEAVVGAQKPTLRASQAEFGQKTIYAGSAVDQEVHEHGVMFTRIRERGIARAPRVSWHEWSAPFDHPSEMTEADFANRENWRAGNPSMAEGLISEQTMEDELQVMAPRTAAVELFGVGDRPRTDGRPDAVIDGEKWAACCDEMSVVLDPVVFSLDITPARSRGAIGVCGARGDRLPHLEVVEHQSGTGWMVGRVVELVEKHRPVAVVCAADSPAESLVPELGREGVDVTMLTATEHASACGMIYDGVEQGTLRVLPHPALAAAVAGAVKRPLGERWAWSRRNSAVDISPLCAVTFALYGHATAKPQVFEPMIAMV